MPTIINSRSLGRTSKSWVGYDPWNSQYCVKEMEDIGF